MGRTAQLQTIEFVSLDNPNVVREVPISEDMTHGEVIGAIRRAFNIPESQQVAIIAEHPVTKERKNISIINGRNILRYVREGYVLKTGVQRLYGGNLLEDVQEVLAFLPPSSDPKFDLDKKVLKFKMKSREDGKTYDIEVKLYSYPNYVYVYIKPYPKYVLNNVKYSINHVRPCCGLKYGIDGEYCDFHIDSFAWDKVRKAPNPLLSLLETMIEALNFSL